MVQKRECIYKKQYLDEAMHKSSFDACMGVEYQFPLFIFANYAQHQALQS